LASGGNDNKLYLWSTHSSANPICKFSEHQAAVKAIAWSPHQVYIILHGSMACWPVVVALQIEQSVSGMP
jgi:WD40 repeat protein